MTRMYSNGTPPFEPIGQVTCAGLVHGLDALCVWVCGVVSPEPGSILHHPSLALHALIRPYTALDHLHAANTRALCYQCSNCCPTDRFLELWGA